MGGQIKQLANQRSFGRVFSKPARRMTKSERLWFAATVDCEGCILNIKKSRGGKHWRIVVAMTNLEFLSKILEVTGCGTINPRGKPQKKNHAQCYAWQVGGMNAVNLLEQVLPYLIVKQDKAVTAIAEYTFTVDPA